MEEHSTPLYDALFLHNEKQPISLHVPGHKYGLVFPEKYTNFSKVLQIDATELDGLDDLHSPEGVILEAEILLAKLYNVKKSFFLVNGTTVGNLAMIYATIKEGDYVLVQRNCHKSILNGLKLVKAKPILLNPKYYQDWHVAGEITIDVIKESYSKYPDCKAIILTYPNYYGMAYDMEEIINFAHEKGIVVLVDEAHGAHFINKDWFPPSALHYGADIVVQSAHKTLPAMTMGSYLHVNSDRVSAEEIHRYLQIFQSSSPSYPIMASLDIARSYLASYSEEDYFYLKNQLQQFRQSLQQIEGINVLDYPNQIGDPLKITIQSSCQYTGYELQQLLQEAGIYTELADPYNVLFVAPLLKKGMSFPFQTIVDKLSDALKGVKTIEKQSSQSIFHIDNFSLLQFIDDDVEAITLPINETEGLISGETIIPYPPGIPLLIKGEAIEHQDIESLQLLLKKGARFHGGKFLKEEKIKVFTDNGGQNE